MRIVLISFSTRGAIGDYLYLLAKELTNYDETFLVVPDYFDKEIKVKEIIKFKTGKNKFISLLNFTNPFQIAKLIINIKRINPNLVHLIFGEGYPPAIFLSLFLRFYKIPLIITIHDPEIHPGNFIEAINGILRIITLKLANGIHIHSGVFLNKILNLGVERNKVFIIPHGSFVPLFAPYKREKIKKEKIILFFGRIEKYKGLEYFVQAGLKMEGFKFLIAGPGRIPKELLKLIKQHPEKFGLINKFLSYEEIAELFQKSIVCVLPYIQATQSSIPLIAAYFGVPVVATKVGAFVEEIPLVNGILVEPKNIDDLIRGIYEAFKKKPFYPQERDFRNLVIEFRKMYFKAVGKDLNN